MASSGSFNTSGYSFSSGNRYLTFKWEATSQSIANNTTTIKWELVGAGSYPYNPVVSDIHVVIDGDVVYDQPSTYHVNVWPGDVVASGTKTITHNSDGTRSFKVTAEAGIYVHAANCSGSGTFTLNTIPRKSTLAVSNGTLGTAQTLKVTRQAGSFTHTITATCGSASATVCTKSTNTSITYTPPLSWASQNTTGTTVSVKFTITTYSGSSNIGSNSKTVTMTIPSSVKPSCSIAVTDPTGIKDIYGSFVKGLSKFKIVVTPTVAYGSAIDTYRSIANGLVYKTANFTTGFIASSGELSITSTVTDKRERSGSTTVKSSVLDYNAPVIVDLIVDRCDEDGSLNEEGEFAIVTFAAEVTNLADINTASYSIRYKKSSEEVYTAVDLTDYVNQFSVTNGSFIFAADSGSSYDIEFTVADNHNVTRRVTTASTGFVLMHWNAEGNGMGIGKISELEKILDIGMQTRFFGGILHPVLEPETDLNDVRTPNTYVGADISYYNYANCPISDGTFSLEVIGMGEDGQVKQRLSYCHKTASSTWERIYYGESWGEWVCVSDFNGQLLWDGRTLSTGGYYMSSGHTATFIEPVSKQKNGIVLVFSRYYEEAASDESFCCHFVPKMAVALHAGRGFNFNLIGMYANSMKYLYIHDDHVTGNDLNVEEARVIGGITYNNKYYILRYVIGV